MLVGIGPCAQMIRSGRLLDRPSRDSTVGWSIITGRDLQKELQGFEPSKSDPKISDEKRDVVRPLKRRRVPSNAI